MIRITVDDFTAEINEGIWLSKDSLLQTQCEFYTLFHPYNPVPSNPDPDYDVAAFVAKNLGQRLPMRMNPNTSRVVCISRRSTSRD